MSWDQWQTWCADNGQSALPGRRRHCGPLYIAWRARTCTPRPRSRETWRRSPPGGAPRRAARIRIPPKTSRSPTACSGASGVPLGWPRRKRRRWWRSALRQVLGTLDDLARGRRGSAACCSAWTGALRAGLELVAINHEDLALVTGGPRADDPAQQDGSLRAGRYHRPAKNTRTRAMTSCGPTWAGWSARGRTMASVFRPGDPPRPRTLLPADWSMTAVWPCSSSAWRRLAGLQGDYSGHSLRAGLATSGRGCGRRRGRHQHAPDAPQVADGHEGVHPACQCVAGQRGCGGRELYSELRKGRKCPSTSSTSRSTSWTSAI